MYELRNQNAAMKFFKSREIDSFSLPKEMDDGNYGGSASVSIETQKVLLEQYCKDHSITDYTFYCDDG